MTDIQLDRRAIDQVVPLLRKALQKYTWLQAALRERDVAADLEYQTRFNGFYRVRRDHCWRQHFFSLLECEKSDSPAFGDILCVLHGKTGRVEASFASKLTATIDPSQPVIDSVVLGNLGF